MSSILLVVADIKKTIFLRMAKNGVPEKPVFWEEEEQWNECRDDIKNRRNKYIAKIGSDSEPL